MKNTYIPKACLAVAGLLASALPLPGSGTHNMAHTTTEIVAVQSSALLPVASPETPEQIIDTLSVPITGYSSTVWQTDDTPFITASGSYVRDGIVAINFLPIGTRIKIPDIYGNKIFVVEDRMHARMKYNVDIWFENYSDAINFGVQHSTIQILGS